jgi:hypothetical protein
LLDRLCILIDDYTRLGPKTTPYKFKVSHYRAMATRRINEFLRESDRLWIRRPSRSARHAPGCAASLHAAFP